MFVDVPRLFPIVLVYGLIFGEYYLFTFIFLPAYQQQYPILGVLVGCEFTLLYIILHVAYYKAQVTSPGYPPFDLAKQYMTDTLEEIKIRTKRNSNIIQNMRKKALFKERNPATKYQSNVELAEDQLDEDEENFDMIKCIQQVSYCFKCQNIKLPRAHHCKECQRCVLRMDHHCPWTNNCVGLKNHRLFCQFIIYALACMYQCVYFIFADYIFYDSVVLKTFNANNRLLCGVCAASSFGLDVSMSLLLYFHIVHLSKNITTVEYHIKEIYIRNPFSKNSVQGNLKEVFGDKLLYWILPLTDKQRRDLQQDDLFEV